MDIVPTILNGYHATIFAYVTARSLLPTRTMNRTLTATIPHLA